MAETRELPILFSTPMVRALLAGTKTQTRRVVKPQPYVDSHGNACWNGGNFGQDGRGPLFQSLASPLPSSKTKRVRCPYGAPGDRLWVREAWACSDAFGDAADAVEYRADGATLAWDGDRLHQREQTCNPVYPGPWKPSIHMPRWASRLTLEVTGVRVERLQDISRGDAIAEGTPCYVCGAAMNGSSEADCHCFHRRAQPSDYRGLWEQINGSGSWDANPWVWVVEFRRIEGQP